jgi:hypothetical protein
MAFSYYTYTGDGTTTQFPVAFGYIRREHVLATVAGAPATFTFVNSTTIQMDATPANGAVVRVYRQTPLTAPLVNFTDGSTLVAADLDTNALQSIYTQQELDDSLVDGLAGVIPNGDKGDITTSVGGSVWVIDNGAVNEVKVATGAITETKVGAGAITETKVGAGAITTAKLANVIAPVVSSLNGGPLAGFRNRIINGTMIVNQRGSSSLSSGLNTVTYLSDRWYGFATGAAVNLSLVSTGFRVTGAAGNTVAIMGQRIESTNSSDLAGATVTLSFLAASSNSIPLSWKVSYASSVNNFTSSTTSNVGAVNTTSSQTTYSATFTLNGAATTGLQIEFFANNFTSGTFDINAVQLEPGPVATPFEQRPIGTELALCQRYAWFPNISYYEQSYGSVGSANLTTLIYFPVTMRVTPSVNAGWVDGFNAFSHSIGAMGTHGAVAQLGSTVAGEFAATINWTSFTAEL